MGDGLVGLDSLDKLPHFIAEWCLKVSPSQEDSVCIICTKCVGHEEVPGDSPLPETEEERDAFVKTVVTCFLSQRSGNVKAIKRTGRGLEERLSCCPTCFGQMSRMVDLFRQLETLCLQFNELRKQVGTAWVKSYCRQKGNITGGHVPSPVKEEFDVVHRWNEEIQKREHIYPSFIRDHWTRSSLSLSNDPQPLVSSRESDIKKNEHQSQETKEREVDTSSFTSVLIKEEVEYDEYDEDHDGYDFILQPEISPSNSMLSDPLADIKLTKLTPVVLLTRLPTRLLAQGDQTGNSSNRFHRAPRKDSSKRTKEKVYYSNADGDRYVPPFDWNLTDLPSYRKRKEVSKLPAAEQNYFQPTKLKDSHTSDQNFSSRISSADHLIPVHIDYNLDELPSRKHRSAVIAAKSKHFTEPGHQELDINVGDELNDDHFADADVFDTGASFSENENSDMGDIDMRLLKQDVKLMGAKEAKTTVQCVDGSYCPPGRPAIVPESGDVKPKDLLVGRGKFECKVCQQAFSTRQKIKEHINTKHKKYMPFKCSSCPKRFINSNNLKMHSLVHVSFSPAHLCDHCDCQFTCNRALVRHRVRVHQLPDPSKSFECTKCLRHFDCPYKFRSHTDCTHGGKHGTKNIRCGLCEFRPRFDSVDELNVHAKSDDHIIVVMQKRNIHCSLCKLKFMSQDDLKTHIECPEHQNQKKKLIAVDLHTYCKICRIQCESRDALLLHRKTDQHSKNLGKLEEKKEVSKGPFPCPECGKVLKSRASVSDHISLMHSKKSYQCEVCGKSFSKPIDFKSHRRSHGNKPMQCDVCGKGFASRGSFLLHCKTHTADPQTYMCESCGKLYASANSLKRHMLLVHPPPGQQGQHRHRCRFCPGTFHSPYKVRRHMTQDHPEVYLKGEIHVCNICWHKFETEELLVEHREVHDGLKCEVCGRMFRIKGHLTKHLRIHTGERPFSCTICGKAFTDTSNLKEHTYRHTGERPHKCDLCDAGFLRRGELMKHREQDHFIQNS